MSQQEEDPSRYTRTLVVKPALSKMYMASNVDTHTLALLHFLTGQPVVALSLFPMSL